MNLTRNLENFEVESVRVSTEISQFTVILRDLLLHTISSRDKCKKLAPEAAPGSNGKILRCKCMYLAWVASGSN